MVGWIQHIPEAWWEEELGNQCSPSIGPWIADSGPSQAVADFSHKAWKQSVHHGSLLINHIFPKA